MLPIIPDEPVALLASKKRAAWYNISQEGNAKCLNRPDNTLNSVTQNVKQIQRRKTVKRYALFLISLLLISGLLLGACAPAAETPAATEPPQPGEGYPAEETEPEAESPYPAPVEGVITVGTDATFPPFEIVDEATLELTGFDIELMRAIAELNGWEIEFANQPFDPMLAALSLCQYDMAIAAITITPERQAEMLFSDPYINAGQIVVVQQADTNIQGLDDLPGTTVGAQLGTTGAIEAQNIDGVTFRPYDTYDLAFLDLANGQVDAVIADYPLALDFVGQFPDQLKVVGEPFTDENYGIAICNNRQDLVEPVNQALQTLQENGTIEALEQEWLVRQGQ